MIETLIPVFLGSLIHFLFGIIFIGTAISIVLREKFKMNPMSPSGEFLFIVSLGILWNTIEFGLVFILCRYLSIPQFLLVIIKYVSDLGIIIAFFIFKRKFYTDSLKKLLYAWKRWDNALILGISILMGIVAIVNYPHVLDSGQLISTLFMKNSSFHLLSAGRYAFGFSALIYFPSFIFQSIPIGTMASGFKLALFFLMGLSAIYCIERMNPTFQAISKILYFTIAAFSFFGLYGGMELGKDSAWGVLFCLVFVLSLFSNEQKYYIDTIIFFLCAISLGMITIPYMMIFLGIYFLVRILPPKISGNKLLFVFIILAELIVCNILMPVNLPIYRREELAGLSRGDFEYRPPTNGESTFYTYMFKYEKDLYRNSEIILLAGFLGIFFFPLAKERFKNPGIKSAALFLPTISFVVLCLTIPARNWLPNTIHAKIPFTPFTPFDTWNLIKDIPQWYVQIITGIFAVLLLDTIIHFISKNSIIQKIAITFLASIAIYFSVYPNISAISDLTTPAYYYSYGGNKNHLISLTLENIHLNKNIKQCFSVGDFPRHYASFVFELQHYYPNIKYYPIYNSHDLNIDIISSSLPAFIISSPEMAETLYQKMPKYNKCYMYQLDYYELEDIGIYAISYSEMTLPCTYFFKKK